MKYDACIGDMVNNNTVYLNFYEQVIDVVSVIYITWCLLSVCLSFPRLLCCIFYSVLPPW